MTALEQFIGIAVLSALVLLALGALVEGIGHLWENVWLERVWRPLAFRFNLPPYRIR
jgi:hypothetical protein